MREIKYLYTIKTYKKTTLYATKVHVRRKKKYTGCINHGKKTKLDVSVWLAYMTFFLLQRRGSNFRLFEGSRDKKASRTTTHCLANMTLNSGKYVTAKESATM